MEPIFFTSRTEFRTWLEENHDAAEELWVGYYKTDADETGIDYGESVEEAICFGWIDGLINAIDDETYKRRFTPRKPDSKWSKANTERVEAMIDAGKMTPAGMASVDAAKASGAWKDAYRVGEDHEIPPALQRALKRNETAWENFRAFSNTDQHAYITLVDDAKTTETREKRIDRIVDLAAQNLRPYDENNKRRL
ncbi:YdeI/OmpD-associated family protein [Halosolutus gelatinilyticus]|uniref:YdeI/OmpD-associated family protein n=1 Tax=Halosolutus gelatinilyticus TaxID=2931975 RepID=UPI001FF13A35|nr:YdeI/OmpD-associated family protein [Halosolutus gelatinilyticus]